MAATKTVNRPHPTTVYARTGKGVLAFKNGSAKVSGEMEEFFSRIDGKASVAELGAQLQMHSKKVEQAIDTLEAEGYIKVFKQGLDQVVADFTEAPDGDAPDLDFTASASLLEIAVREAAKAKAVAEASAAQQPPDATAAAAASQPGAQAEGTTGHESLEARIRELEAALGRAQEQVGAERAARENAEAEGKAAARARNDAVKALAQARSSGAKAKQADAEGEKSLQEALAQAQDRVAHVEAQLETEREIREKTVETLRKSQSEAEAGRNAAEMRVKEMEIARESAEKVDRQNREKVRQLEGQLETVQRARAESDAAFATEAAVARSAIAQLAEAKVTHEKALEAAREQAERTTQAERDLETERRARAEAEARASEERSGREKIAQALLDIRTVIDSIEGEAKTKR